MHNFASFRVLNGTEEEKEEEEEEEAVSYTHLREHETREGVVWGGVV